LDINHKLFNLYQFLDGMVIICYKDQLIHLGILDQFLWKHLIWSNHQKDQLKNHLEYHFKMFIKLVGLVQLQLVELRLVFWNQVCQLYLLLMEINLKLNQLKCIMKLLLKLFLEIILDLTLKVYLLLILKEVMLLVMLRMILLKKLRIS
jgi:hypothetical protein